MMKFSEVVLLQAALFIKPLAIQQVKLESLRRNKTLAQNYTAYCKICYKVSKVIYAVLL